MKISLSTKFLLAAMLVIVSAGCQKNEPTMEGPAEKAGQKIDEAASKAAVHLNTIAEKAGQGLSKAGEKLEDAAKDARANQEKDQASQPGQ